MSLGNIFKKKASSDKRYSLSQSAVIMSAALLLSMNVMRVSSDMQRSREGDDLDVDEIELVEDLFGKSVNTGVVKKHFHDDRHGSHIASVSGLSTRHIDFWGKQYHSDNYAKDRSFFRFGLFIHEMTHIWQNQNQYMLRNLTNNCSVYDYELTGTSSFDEFCNEQQASIMEDYAKVFLHPESRHFYGGIYKGDVEQLKRVVEDKFPAARVTRERLEADDRRKDASKRFEQSPAGREFSVAPRLF